MSMANAVTQDRTGDLQIFSLTLSQLSYRGSISYELFNYQETNDVKWQQVAVLDDIFSRGRL